MVAQSLLNIVIINYKTPQLTTDCLATVVVDIEGIDAHVTVVDNASGDGSEQIIRQWITDNNHADKVSLVESPENSGFSGGNNLGIKYRKAQLYLLLNSDTLVKDGAIGQLIKTAAQYPDAGIVSPRLEWPDATPQISCFRFHSPFSEMIDSAHTSIITNLLGRYRVPIEVSDGITWPEWTSFACVLVKSELVEQVGLMDDDYFLYYEDSDYCKMAQRFGWRVLNDPSSHVVHLRGGSGDVKSNIKSKRRLPRYYYESRARFMRKNYGPLGPLTANVLWNLGRVLSLFRELTGTKQVTTCDKQWLDIWTNTFGVKFKGKN